MTLKTTRLSKVNFKLLYMFLAVAEHNSFRIAAESLNRSQSAVSMQIKQLEDQLGVLLFHRTTRNVQLTKEGENLLRHAQRAIAEWDIGLKEIRDIANVNNGVLSVSCVPTIASTLLPRVIALFQKKHPQIRIVLRELPAKELLDSLRNRDIDFGIGPAAEGNSEFSFVPIITDPIYVLAASTFPFKKAAVDLASLRDFPILLNSTTAALREQLDRATQADGFKLNVTCEALQANTVVALALEGLGVAILPRVAIPLKLPKSVRALPIVNPTLERTIGMITLRGRSLSPAAQRFKDILIERLNAAV